MVLRARMEGESEPVSLPSLAVADIDTLRRDAYDARRKHLVMLRCLECGNPVHPRRYPSGLDIFAHNPGQAEVCVVAHGESVLHQSVKTHVCRSAGRVKGWTAEVEVRGDGIDPLTGFPPVVDVVATPDEPSAKPLGFEIQVSPITDTAVMSRQEVRDRWLAGCAWITPGAVPAWSHQVSWLGIDERRMVTGGLVVWKDGDHVPDEPRSLSVVVADQLRHRIEWIEGVGYAIPGAWSPAKRRRDMAQRDGVHSPTVTCLRPTSDDIEQLSMWREVRNAPNLVPMSRAEWRQVPIDQQMWRPPGDRGVEIEEVTSRIRVRAAAQRIEWRQKKPSRF